MRFGAAVAKYLKQVGVKTVFGIPGVHTVELYRAFDESGLQLICPRHEQGAAFMADGYYRTSGEAAACFLITGPGVLNALTPIAQAWHDSSPMFVIASSIRTDTAGRHRGELHDTPDLTETLRPFTLMSETVTDFHRFREVIDSAISRWREERPRPVFIQIPTDILETEILETEILETEILEKEILEKEILEPALEMGSGRSAVYSQMDEPPGFQELLAALDRSTRPTIIVGGGSLGAGVGVAELARRLHAPVFLTGNAKHLLGESSLCNAGVSLSFPAAHRVLERSDAVLVLGSELSDFEFNPDGGSMPHLTQILRVDLDDMALASRPAAHAIRTDIAAFLKLCLDSPQLREHRSESDWTREALFEVKSEVHAAFLADPYREWILAVESSLPKDTVVALDSAQLAYQLHLYLGSCDSMTWLAPYGFGTLGPALPMAVGAAIASPERPVVAFAGDGGVLFTVSELATASHLGRQLTLVVWDNSGYQQIETSFIAAGIAPIAVETSCASLELVARGLGATTFVVHTPEELCVRLKEAVIVPELRVIIVAATTRVGQNIGASGEAPPASVTQAPVLPVA